MSQSLTQRLLEELERIPLIDPHTHIDPHAPTAKTLADILGYHYYTELAHSAGMPKEEIEEPNLEPRELVRRLVPWLGAIENTTALSWLVEMCRGLFDFDEDRITEANWEALYDRTAELMAQPDWEQRVLDRSGLEAVFLTNAFDDPLEGFDTSRYVPCLRTDDLVFHFQQEETRRRLAQATGIEVSDRRTLLEALGALFDHFISKGARACAISLPPDFSPAPVDETTANQLVAAACRGRELTAEESRLLAKEVFWALVSMCAEHGLPFDLMIGVHRRVYEAGVYQGQDLFDKRTSLYDYRKLFNAFPRVTFPISVLAHTSNQELVAYSWIFPNVVTNGHWWYSNIPAFIETDLRARLQGVPLTKQIGYYSDMYKLEFARPKFAMYRCILADVLARDFVVARGYSEERALALGRTVLRDNVERIFRVGAHRSD